MYFNCRTTLVEMFRTTFAGDFRFEGNRAIVFDIADTPPTDALGFCIAAALTYHRNKPARAWKYDGAGKNQAEIFEREHERPCRTSGH
ncbi:MAG: hypothetical protein K9J42_01705 [Sulfuritalea sp.]|nr:hypothetical protein [Sulfuritalea sp.]